MADKFSFRKDPEKQYDEKMRARATQRLLLIGLVCAYIIYQLYQIVSAKIAQVNPMSWTEVIISCAVLGIGIVIVLLLALKRMFKQLEDSEITTESDEKEMPSIIEETPSIMEDETKNE